MLNAKKIVIRVDLDREYVEGILRDDPAAFPSCAPKFMAEYENYYANK
jgi:hypothetical protein